MYDSCVKLGLPKLQEQLSTCSLKPLTNAECRECWQTPDLEFDRLASHCAGLPIPELEESSINPKNGL
jgi:hypothetical protein